MLRIKHKDQARIRRKPLTSTELPRCCGSTHTHMAPSNLTLSPPPPPLHTKHTNLTVSSFGFQRQNWLQTVNSFVLWTRRIRATGWFCVYYVEHIQDRTNLRIGGWRRFLPDGENSHVCVQDTAAFLQCHVTGLLFSSSWQLNTNNGLADVLGFIVCAQGGVQDMTGVINDHALCLAWQRNCSTICMCSILSPSLGVIGTPGEACSFSAVEVLGNEAAPS